MFVVAYQPPRAAARWLIERLLDVERFSAGGRAAGVERDLLHARFGLPQQLFTTAFKRLTALVNSDRFLQRHFAVFKSSDDRLKLFDRPFERKLFDIAIGRVACAAQSILLGHCRLLEPLSELHELVFGASLSLNW